MGFLNTISTIAGGVGGFVLGGPPGAAIGAGLADQATGGGTLSALTGGGQQDRLDTLTSGQQRIQGIVDPLLADFNRNTLDNTTGYTNTLTGQLFPQILTGKTKNEGLASISDASTAANAASASQFSANTSAITSGQQQIQALTDQQRAELVSLKSDAVTRGDVATEGLVNDILAGKQDISAITSGGQDVNASSLDKAGDVVNKLGQNITDFVQAGMGDANAFEQQLRQDANDFERVGRADVKVFEQAALEDLQASQNGVENVRLKKAKTAALSALAPLGLTDDTNVVKAVTEGLGNVLTNVESIFAPLRTQVRQTALGAREGVGLQALQTKQEAGKGALASKQSTREVALGAETTAAGLETSVLQSYIAGNTQLTTAELASSVQLTELDVQQKQDIRHSVDSFIKQAADQGIQLDAIEASAIENATARLIQANNIMGDQTITQANTDAARTLQLSQADLAARMAFLSQLETTNFRSQNQLVDLINSFSAQGNAITQLLGQAASPGEQSLASILAIAETGAKVAAAGA
jgi:hypothetical protein